MRVATAQLPAIDDSDDKVFTTPNAVVMLDGASAFVPVPVPASTYADYLGAHLRDTLTAQPHIDLTTALSEAISDIARALDLHEGESPSSTVTIARRRGDVLELLILGDNLVMLPGEILIDDRLDVLDLAPRRKYRERLAAGSGYDDEHKALLRKLQTLQAQHRNREGGYWIAETDPAAAHHAITTNRTTTAAPWAVLATDGAYNTLAHLDRADPQLLADADTGQLGELLEQCQRWEADTDPHGASLQRSKRHDDKSIAALRFTRH